MAYRKFDDPAMSRHNDEGKVNPNFPKEGWRKALHGVLNRVIYGGGAGTASSTFDGWLTTGGTAGVALGQTLTVIINGRYGSAAAMANIMLPKGTQGSGTWVKYLVSSGFGTSGTVTAGNEGASSTAARLPNCPDGHVALGFLEYNTTSGAFNRFGGGTAGGYNVISGNIAATCGTVVALTELMHMPMDEV